MDYKECKFYTKSGKYNHKDAPEPGRSDCIGKEPCQAWEDDLSLPENPYWDEPQRAIGFETGEQCMLKAGFKRVSGG